MKVQHEVKLNCAEMMMIRWMCGVKLNKQKVKNSRELLGLEPVSLMIKKRVEQKDDNDWVKHCMAWEAEGIRQRVRPKKT